MAKYNPNATPDSEQWQALDESARIHLVERYHKSKRIPMPSRKAHATIHVIVENQVALGDELNVASTLDRLTTEGLSRHEALHAIGCVLSGYMHRLMSGKHTEFNESAYAADLNDLTAETWQEMCESE